MAHKKCSREHFFGPSVTPHTPRWNESSLSVFERRAPSMTDQTFRLRSLTLLGSAILALMGPGCSLYGDTAGGSDIAGAGGGGNGGGSGAGSSATNGGSTGTGGGSGAGGSAKDGGSSGK